MKQPVAAGIANDRLEYAAVICGSPPDLLRPQIQKLAVVAPYTVILTTLILQH